MLKNSMPMEWTSQASDDGHCRSTDSIHWLSHPWKAWPISWVNVPMSDSSPVELQRIATRPSSGKLVQ